MRLLTINLLAAALLIFGATSAGAVSIQLDTSYINGTILSTSDYVTVDVILTADVPGTQIFGVGVAFETAGLSYEQGLSSSPSYILYAPSTGADPLVRYMVPLGQNLALWPGTTPPGMGVVRNEWIEANGGATSATGVFTISTLVFHVNGIGDGFLDIYASMAEGGGTMLINGVETPVMITATDGNGDPFTGVTTPEPTTALLIGLGLVGLGLAGRNRD